MQLHPGRAAEYRRRHDAIWPELVDVLLAARIQDYRIFLDEETGALFAIMTHWDEHHLQRLAQNDVMRRWWDMMADLMVTQHDNRPMEAELTPIFDLAEHVPPTGRTVRGHEVDGDR